MNLSEATVLSNFQVNARYWKMILNISNFMTSSVKPGQFFHIQCSNEHAPILRRPFSIYKINERENTLEFLYLVKGTGTKKLSEKQPGESLSILGPLGNSFSINQSSSGILLAGRGVGIATLSALAYHSVKMNIPCTAILSARSEKDVLVKKELEAAGVSVLAVTDEDGTSEISRVEKLVLNLMKEKKLDSVYTCGSKRLTTMLQTLAIRHRLFAQAALEENMGCGMGACFACVCDIREQNEIRSVRICREGPVFPLEKVVLS
ncbi:MULTISPECIES: dihydroorotate dehydrogenase electron transfer subunit [Bacillus]|uniref:Dihydrdoorotate oxidase n=2 Tax=Bacillus TaxID=1386 RepID=A0A0M4FUX8_9BACI|nr:MULTISPECIES: dihydroorotate dehydrogenase electron transfer subunit [Bacillus]ALC80375.1 dihydrdoorotate oxidase [Bacillus gobiensis]MBP1083778.1 dihydroorotate dehydrogenase electron transfer subunit [Bacillus capparidis]MED1098263.1 dihydroorotate dehydrogenase electron transfer subunit [Bacillus capparidis]